MGYSSGISLDISEFRKMGYKDFQIDSRSVSEGSLFFAMRGEREDGHNFLEDAKEKGALGAVVRADYSGKGYGMRLFRVFDVLGELQNMAKRALLKERVIGITGSFGKSTTKGFLKTLLEGRYRVFGGYKNYNSQAGLPLSLLNHFLKGESSDIFILELGMSRAGEISKLVDITKPFFSVLTGVEYVHSKNFKTLLDIAREKAEIFKRAKSGVLNHALLRYRELFYKRDIKTFSIKSRKADFFLKRDGENIFIYEGGKRYSFQKIFKEGNLLEDFLAAYAAAREIGISPREIGERVKFLKPPPMRFEKIVKKGILFIVDCYNANRISTVAALENIKDMVGRKIFIFGDMLELGKFSAKMHMEVAKKTEEVADVLITIGRRSEIVHNYFSKEKARFETIFDIVKYLDRNLKKGDVVLIKGSRDMEMERIFKLFMGKL